tara:strand:+ start:909 stop:1214 length:306 start_codon:yes stop_codon:yes gene_type:complete
MTSTPLPATYRPLTEEPLRSILFEYNVAKEMYLDAMHSRSFTRADLEVLRSVAIKAGDAVNDYYGESVITITTFSNAYTSDMRHLRGWCEDPDTGEYRYYK